eukprot:14396023-Alexandrium_andersonii.AAC.1
MLRADNAGDAAAGRRPAPPHQTCHPMHALAIMGNVFAHRAPERPAKPNDERKGEAEQQPKEVGRRTPAKETEQPAGART